MQASLFDETDIETKPGKAQRCPGCGFRFFGKGAKTADAVYCDEECRDNFSARAEKDL